MNHRNSRYYDNGFYNNNQQQPSTSESFASGWFSSGSSQQRFAPPKQPPPGFNSRFNGPQFQQPPRQHFPPQNDLFSRRPSDHRSHSQKRSHSSLDFQQPGSAPRAPELRRQGQPPRINSNDASSPASKRFLQKQTSVDSQNSQNSKLSPTRPQNGLQGPQNGPQEPKKLGKKAQKKANRLAQLTPAQQAQAQKDKEWKELFEKALAFLELAKPDEEVNALLHHLQPSRASWNELKIEIDRAIHRLMAPLDVAEVFVFGSTLTGLDFFGSDLDYFVELKSPPTTPEQTRKALQMLDKLARFSGEFRIICSILFARVPISRLLHVRSKTVCDLNLTSKFGYFNSCFIGNILRYDHRIKGLAVIVKLWSKQYKISERMIASNYCLIMLVIFYLQNLEQPMLGTIKENQEGREPKILDQKLRWNVYFNDSMNKSKNNKQTLRQLLVGFFEFYRKLNYTSYVLSMFNGDLIPRAQFENHPDFAFYREVVAQGELPHLNLKNENSFVVQDGFEQNLNVGIKVMKHAGIFFELIKISYEKCKEWKDLPFSKMLTMLLTSLPTPKAEKPVPKKKKQFTMTIHSVGGDLKVSFCWIYRKMSHQKISDDKKYSKLFFLGFIKKRPLKKYPMIKNIQNIFLIMHRKMSQQETSRCKKYSKYFFFGSIRKCPIKNIP